MKTKILFFSLLIIAFLTSCQKDGIELTQDQKCSNILYFESFEEYKSEINKVLHMSEAELSKWQESKGFKSLGLEAETFYKSIKPEKFKSKEEVKQFVAKNSNYLQLIEENNGEMTLETKYYNSPVRYFMNEEGMFQINKTICKVFENSIVMTSEQNFEELRNSDYEEASSIAENVVRFNKIAEKSTESNCGTGGVNRSDVGNERIRLTIGCGQSDFYNYFGYQDVEGYFEARAYNRILFVWYRCSRRISGNFQQNISYLTETGQRESGSFSYYANLVESYALEEYISVGQVPSPYYDMNVYFNSFNCWANIPATYNATLICN